jgi:hypothetical protein
MSNLNYSTYITQLITLNSIASSTDTNFTNVLPGCIDYAEQRMYRELDPMVTRVTDTSATVSSGVRTFNLPTTTGTFLVVEGVNIISSVGAPATTGTRNPAYNTSREFLDSVYPSAASSNCGLPGFWTLASNTQIIFGPAPDAAYVAEIVGTQRPTPLSSGNSSTFLTQVFPDAFMAASMVYMAAFQRDFGAQSENPQVAQSWENQYKTLMQSASMEEMRKRYFGPGWTAMSPSPISTPPRA